MSTATEHTKTTDAQSRRIVEDFRILDTETLHHGRPEWATLRVTTVHYPNRKAYVSRVSRVMADDSGGYRTNFDLMDGSADPAPVVQTPAGRYSARTLEDVHGRYFSEHLAGVGQMPPALEWAREAVNA
ncbi:MAG: hypothetical protein K0S37_795 [Microbacterium sp.]|nr:hypothetical protein [Microbacterium sp.]